MGFGSLPTLPITRNIFQVLEHLEGFIPVSVVAYNDNFIGGADLFWVRPGPVLKGGPRTSRREAGVTLNETAVTAFGGVSIPTAASRLGSLRHARRTLFQPERLDRAAGRRFGLFSGTHRQQGLGHADRRLRTRHRIDDQSWFMNVLADLGGWSDSATGQALASVGYNWTQNWSTTLGYRVMYTYENQDTGFNYLHFRSRTRGLTSLLPAEELPLPAVDVRAVRRLKYSF